MIEPNKVNMVGVSQVRPHRFRDEQEAQRCADELATMLESADANIAIKIYRLMDGEGEYTVSLSKWVRQADRPFDINHVEEVWKKEIGVFEGGFRGE